MPVSASAEMIHGIVVIRYLNPRPTTSETVQRILGEMEDEVAIDGESSFEARAADKAVKLKDRGWDTPPQSHRRHAFPRWKQRVPANRRQSIRFPR